MQNQKSALGLDANITALIGYPIGILALILIFIEKENRFVRFHAFQSLLFWVAITVLYIVMGVILGIFFAISWSLGALISSLMSLLGLVVLAAVVFLAYKAYQGELYKLPVIGDMAEKWV